LQKINELNTFSLHDEADVDSLDLESDDSGEQQSGSEVDSDAEEPMDVQVTAECPRCNITMGKEKGATKCLTCFMVKAGSSYQCGKKCFVFDCGEVLPTGVCDQEISAAKGWKCTKNTHKDDPNGEENFLSTL